MKNIFQIGACLAFILLIGCTKELDQQPVSSTATTNFYTNTSDFIQAVNGVYNKLRAYPDQQLWMGEMRSDNVTITTDGNRDFQGINDFSPNLTTTAFVVGTWNNDFNGIYNANGVLDALVTKSSNIADTALARRFGAECRFLRAFYYFDLLRFFGKLPIIDKVLSPAEVAVVQRSPVKDVYDFIVSDLQYAAANLPVSYAAADVGRPTTNAAKGLLGLVYLTKSGPTYGIDGGPGINSNEYDKALVQFNSVVASGQYTFGTDYPSIFSYTNENNKEVLFDVQYMTTSNGASYPSQLVPSAYWTGLGLSGYDNAYGTSTYNTTKNLIQSYRTSAGGLLPIDKRDTFCIQHGFALSTATPLVLDTSRPFEKKYINVTKRGTGRADWPINFIVMRYTDVLMMRAECILHGATGTQAEVDAIINQVRARGGVTATVANANITMLMEERRREFAGEGLRWNDLVREGMAVSTMNAWIASDAIPTIKTVIPQFIIYPIPQAELLAKSGLYTQNDGYY